MTRIALVVLLAACGAPMPVPDAAVTDARAVVRTLTITSDVFADPGPGARLSDGTVVTAGTGDLWLAQRSTVSIYAAAPLGICDLGVFDTLEAVPTDASACMGAAADSIVLGANADGPDAWAGRAWLVFSDTSLDLPAIYRARVVNDSVANPHVTLVFEYEPLP